MRTVLAAFVVVISLAVLEGARWGVEIMRFAVGQTPVTSYAQAGAEGPVVVVAHGFAGSQQMMQGFALPLARAGYRVYAFDFLGHGRHPLPMSGDVNVIDGTTRLLVEQTRAVMDAVGEGPVALLGHSMATDVLVRAAEGRDDVGPIVLISAFSQAIDGAFPRDLLLVSGAWEPGLRAFGLRAAQMVVPEAGEAETVVAGDVRRRAVAAPFSEHVSVLQSRVARAEAVTWLDRSFDRYSIVTAQATGWAILGLLGGLVLIYRSIAARLPERAAVSVVVSRRQMAVLLGVPLVMAPLIAVPLNPAFLPVLVADYLGLHLLVFGALQLGLLWWWKALPSGFDPRGFAVLLAWCAVFGFALDRYAANFWPTAERLWVMAVLSLGAVPYMLADAALTHGARLRRRLAVRTAFLLSLGIAVALDFQGLFFLLMISPVLILFYMVFGPMAQHTGRRVGPLAPGLALGIVLAWALGVSFPLFQA